MKEKTSVAIIVLILLLAGGIAYYFQPNFSEFNFYKSVLTISGNNVTETLSYLTNQEYHTLYRTFQSYIADPGANIPNSVSITNVECSKGTPYFRTISKCYNSEGISTSCMAYTEDNEYGCSFGNVYGFSENTNYWISSQYVLNPQNLFRINNNYYIKFVVYNENNHKNLVTGDNLIVNGNAVTAKRYYPDEQVIIYIPYSGSTVGFNVISQNSFEFDNKTLKHLFVLFVFLSPGILFFIAWYFFGKEKSEADIPERLSLYPNKRKAWEVAAFFNPPFGSLNKNIIPTMLTDFYNRKVIDINIKDKDVWVKINNHKGDLSKVEKHFIKVLKFFEENSKKEGAYFLLNYSKIKWGKRSELGEIYTALALEIKQEKKEYQSHNGPAVVLASLFILTFFWIALLPAASPILWVFAFFSFITIVIIGTTTTILMKFKKDYYLEYRQWQSFKKFLKESPSMKIHGHKGTIIWGEFLVYATAFGVAEKVLKEMKDQKIITEAQYHNYVIISSPSTLSSYTGGFAGSSSGSGGFGGGFSGAGGGGVGGGGGGGR